MGVGRFAWVDVLVGLGRGELSYGVASGYVGFCCVLLHF